MSHYHLAQLNVSELRAPLDSPQLADFVSQLGPINELADRSPGFVWRLAAPGGNDATTLRPYGDGIIVNFSLWESYEALWDFVYRSRHLDVLRRRREWFHRMAQAHVVLWWVPAGCTPTVEEAVERLETLRHEGSSERAFTFRDPHPPPEGQPDASGLPGKQGRPEPRTSEPAPLH